MEATATTLGVEVAKAQASTIQERVQLSKSVADLTTAAVMAYVSF